MSANKPTLRDVALQSGVSPSTVSFVLTDAPNQTIPEATRERVKAAAKALNYRPNRLAKALREGSSNIVLVNTGRTITGHSTHSFLNGIESELTDQDCVMLVIRNEDPHSVPAEILDTILPRAVIHLEDISPIQGAGDPVVEGGWDHGLASHTATQIQYLVAQGHKEIAFVVPDPASSPIFTSQRASQVAESAARLGIKAAVPLQISADPSKTADLLKGFVQAHPRVTALACYSDNTAFAVLSAMQALGLSAPQDLAVIGFDRSPQAELWTPKLTTVQINAHNHGRRIARLALGVEPGEWGTDPSVIVPGHTA